MWINHLKLKGLSFPNFKVSIKYPNHQIIQKIMWEIHMHEMRAQLECEKYLETSDIWQLGKGNYDRQLFMSWLRDSLWKNSSEGPAGG